LQTTKTETPQRHGELLVKQFFKGEHVDSSKLQYYVDEQID